jgi:hypothetical protein
LLSSQTFIFLFAVTIAPVELVEEAELGVEEGPVELGLKGLVRSARRDVEFLDDRFLSL